MSLQFLYILLASALSNVLLKYWLLLSLINLLTLVCCKNLLSSLHYELHFYAKTPLMFKYNVLDIALTPTCSYAKPRRNWFCHHPDANTLHFLCVYFLMWNCVKHFSQTLYRVTIFRRVQKSYWTPRRIVLKLFLH